MIFSAVAIFAPLAKCFARIPLDTAFRSLETDVRRSAGGLAEAGGLVGGLVGWLVGWRGYALLGKTKGMCASVSRYVCFGQAV